MKKVTQAGSGNPERGERVSSLQPIWDIPLHGGPEGWQDMQDRMNGIGGDESKKELRIITLDEAEKTTVELGAGAITIYSAPEGCVIDPRDRYTEAAGGNLYNTFVDMGKLLANAEMDGTIVEESKRWTPETLPEDVEVQDYQNGSTDIVSQMCDEIEGFDYRDGLMGWLDPVNCWEYQTASAEVFKRFAPDLDAVTIGIMRAGGVAGAAAGVPFDHQIPFDAKRHNLLTQRNHLGIGLTLSSAQLDQLKTAKDAGASLYIPERALASGSSIIALLMALQARDMLPNSVKVAAMGAAQQGVEFMREVLPKEANGQQLKVQYKIGRLSWRLTGGEHPFYIESEKGNYMVSDGGDYADLLLPPQYRKVWPGYLEEKHINALRNLRDEEDPDVVQDPFDIVDLFDLQVGEEFTLQLATQLSNEFVARSAPEKQNSARFRVGEVLTGRTYVNTSAHKHSV